MTIAAQQVKELRDMTGAGMMDCKRALTETNGDLERARALLRERGLAKAQKKLGRETGEGAIFSYVHSNAKIAVLVELTCETDFVARNVEFQALGRELAMQIAASNPIALRPEDVPEEVVRAERDLYRQQCADKPQNIQDRIMDGKLQKFYQENCLLMQPYMRDETKTVQDLLTEAIAKLGENMEVRRFVRLDTRG